MKEMRTNCKQQSFRNMTARQNLRENRTGPRPLSPVLQWTHIADCTRSRERDRGNSPSSVFPLSIIPLLLFCFVLRQLSLLEAKTGTLHANSGLRINEDGRQQGRTNQRTNTRFKGHFGTRVTGLRIRALLWYSRVWWKNHSFYSYQGRGKDSEMVSKSWPLWRMRSIQ